MIRLIAVVVAFHSASCVKSQAKMCGAFTCGSGQTCSLDGTHCVSELALNACSGMGLEDGAACSSLDVPNGVCSIGICLFSGCGNNILEPKSGEVCDDGNRISGDGCGANCDSKEVCGDAIVDALVNEVCDCGSDASHVPPGCATINSDSPNATCRTTCTPQRCGDGVIDAPSENCDDNNTAPGDGCRADCGGRWTVLPSGTLFALESISAVTVSDAWAIAGTRILHWDGATWTSLPSPDSAIETYIDVCARSAQETYVIGTFNSGVGTKVYKHVGTATQGTWSLVATNGRRWRALYCNATGMWAAGSDPNSADVNQGRVGVWNGSTFNEFPPSPYFPSEAYDVWVSPSGGIYAVDGTGTFKQNSGAVGGWDVPGGFQPGMRIAGSSDTDITVIDQFAKPGTTWHFNGSSWSQPLHSDELTAEGVDANGATTVIVGNSGGVMFCDPTGCTASTTPVTSTLAAAAVLGPKQVFIVGEHGTILY